MPSSTCCSRGSTSSQFRATCTSSLSWHSVVSFPVVRHVAGSYPVSCLFLGWAGNMVLPLREKASQVVHCVVVASSEDNWWRHCSCMVPRNAGRSRQCSNCVAGGPTQIKIDGWWEASDLVLFSQEWVYSARDGRCHGPAVVSRRTMARH